MAILPIDDSGHHIQALRPGKAQTLAIAVSPVTSTPLGVTTTVVRVVGTSPSFIAFGSGTVVPGAGHYLPAETPEYFRVIPGETLAVVRAESDGTLFLAEMQ